MRVITTTYYSFSELSPEAQTRALSDLDSRWTFTDYDHEVARADAVTAFCEAAGVDEDADTTDLAGALDLSFTQGSGFSVTGELVVGGVAYRIVPGHLRNHYVHENTVNVVLAEDEYADVPEDLQETLRAAMRTGYDAAEAYYWAVTSDEALRERLAEDGDLERLEFFEDGTVATPSPY